MSRTKIGEIVSTIRKQIKVINKDAFVTDRFIYSLVKKHANWLLHREDSKNKLLSFSASFQTLDFVELIEVDKVEASCTGLQSGCIIRRTKDKLPDFFHGYYGPIIRSVSSIDGSHQLEETTPATYINITSSKNYKYNKTKYYWFLNDYMYFPDIPWDAVKIEGMFEDDISFYKCCPEDSCISMQDRTFSVPAYLQGEIESRVLREDLAFMLQVPADPTHDKQNINR
jgi:hypothetical protein